MKELQRLRSQLSSADYHHVTVLILGMLTMLVGEFSTALPIAEILRNFNNGGTTVQLVNILPLAILALMYPLGPVWLQKRTVTALFRDSLKVFIIGTVIIGLAYTLPLMLVGRIIQAVGCGMMLPMFATLISALLPEDSRFSDFNQLEDIITGVATITALLLTGMSFLILHAWQWANLLVILGSLIVYGMANEIEIDLEAQKYSIEWVNFGLSGGFLLLIGGMVLLTKTGLALASWWRWFFLLSALICLALYVRREWQVKNPLIDFRGLLDVRYLRAVLLQGIGGASFASLLVIGVLYLRQGLHYATWAIGVSLIPGIVVRLLVHHGTIPLLKNVFTIKRIRMATGIMMLGWGCLTIFSTYLNLLLFVILTMLIEAGHGLLIQVGKQLNQRPRSRRLINMADIFAGQFKLMATSLILTVLSVVLQNVTESWSFSGLPGQLSSLAGYRAAFLVFFIITILSWLVTMIAGRNYNLSKHIVK